MTIAPPPVIDYRTALLWMLAGLVAGVVGFRDLNVTYLLIPLWTLTGYEVLQRGAELRTRGMEFLVVYLGITVLVLLSYAVGQLSAGWHRNFAAFRGAWLGG